MCANTPIQFQFKLYFSINHSNEVWLVCSEWYNNSIRVYHHFCSRFPIYLSDVVISISARISRFTNGRCLNYESLFGYSPTSYSDQMITLRSRNSFDLSRSLNRRLVLMKWYMVVNMSLKGFICQWFCRDRKWLFGFRSPDFYSHICPEFVDLLCSLNVPQLVFWFIRSLGVHLEVSFIYFSLVELFFVLNSRSIIVFSL